MAAIGTGWIDGAWIEGGWVAGAWDVSGGAPTLFGSISNKSEESNSGSHVFNLSVNFIGATSYSIVPAVEPGWTFVVGTGVLTIDTDADATFGPFTVSGINGFGTTPQNAFTVKVGDAGENMALSQAMDQKSSIAFPPTDIERNY